MKIGDVVWALKTQRGLFIRAVIDDSGEAANAAWDMAQSGKFKALSGAASDCGLQLRGVVDAVKYYAQWYLKEVSMCRQEPILTAECGRPLTGSTPSSPDSP